MSVGAAGWLQGGLLVVALAVAYRPLGDYMAHIFTTDRHWRVERCVYRLIGVDADADQRWPTYLRGRAGVLRGVGGVPLRLPAPASNICCFRWVSRR